MSKKADAVLDDVRKYFDDKVMNLSRSDYKLVLQGMSSTLESYEDCMRDEEREADES